MTMFLPFSCSPGKACLLEPEYMQVSALCPPLPRGRAGQPRSQFHTLFETHCVSFKQGPQENTKGIKQLVDMFHVCCPKRECAYNRPGAGVGGAAGGQAGGSSHR